MRGALCFFLFSWVGKSGIRWFRNLCSNLGYRADYPGIGTRHDTFERQAGNRTLCFPRSKPDYFIQAYLLIYSMKHLFIGR